MAVSVVLRLVPASLGAGELVGEAEIVATGQRRLVRSAADLVAFLTQAAADGGFGDPAPAVSGGGDESS